MLNEMIFLKKSCSGIAEPKCSKMDPPKIFKFYEKSTLNFFSDFFFLFSIQVLVDLKAPKWPKVLCF